MYEPVTVESPLINYCGHLLNTIRFSWARHIARSSRISTAAKTGLSPNLARRQAGMSRNASSLSSSMWIHPLRNSPGGIRSSVFPCAADTAEGTPRPNLGHPGRRSPWRSWRFTSRRGGQRAGWRPGAVLPPAGDHAVLKCADARCREPGRPSRGLQALDLRCAPARRRSIHAATRQAGEQCRAGRPRGSLRTWQSHGHQPTGHLQRLPSQLPGVAQGIKTPGAAIAVRPCHVGADLLADAEAPQIIRSAGPATSRYCSLNRCTSIWSG